MANLLDMQKILGGIQQQYPVTPPTQPSAPTPTVDPKAGRNQKLAMMLYALGGALKGDEDFVVKTLQLKEMQEGKKKEKEQKEAYDEFLKKLPEGSFKDLTKALGYKKLPELLLKKYEAETREPTQVPADIQKLNQVKSLRERLNRSSPNFDPSYTEEKFRQDASVLGVSSNLFAKTKTEFIEEYMEQMRTMKNISGRPIYTDEQSRNMAESAYELIYGQEQTEEEVIDLGSL